MCLRWRAAMCFKGVERAILRAIAALPLSAQALLASAQSASAAGNASPSPGEIIGPGVSLLGWAAIAAVFAFPARWLLVKIWGAPIRYRWVFLGVYAHCLLLGLVCSSGASADCGQGVGLALFGVAMISAVLAVPVRWALTKFLGAQVMYGRVFLYVYALCALCIFPMLAISAFEGAFR